MFFSVILPIYNVEKYLAECVESVLKQTFGDYELILVDDGSKDSSGKICDEYAQRDSRIRVIHKENGGASDSRNVGLKNALGDYIVYIDSDDYIIADDFLSDLYDEIKIKNSDVVLYKFCKFYDDTNKMEKCTFSLDFLEKVKNTDELLFELVKHDAYYGMAWIKAFKRSIAVENDIFFDVNLVCEDMDWYFNLVLNSSTISAIDRSYIAYRQRSGSITTTMKLKNLTDFIYVLEKWSKRINNADISDIKRKALYGALAKYYANMLVVYSRLKDKEKKQYKKQIKSLAYLLNYGLSARPLQIRKFYKLLGFGGVILMLKIYDKIK